MAVICFFMAQSRYTSAYLGNIFLYFMCLSSFFNFSSPLPSSYRGTPSCFSILPVFPLSSTPFLFPSFSHILSKPLLFLLFHSTKYPLSVHYTFVTTWSRMLLQKPTVAQVINNFTLLCNPKAHYWVHSSPVLSQTNLDLISIYGTF
jgi:hypothetical protein